MKISKIAIKFGVSKKILKYGTWEIIFNIDLIDEHVGATVGDLYITDITTKQVEKIELLSNYFAVQNAIDNSGNYYYLHPVENYKVYLAINKLVKITNKLKKISRDSETKILEEQRDKIVCLGEFLIDISPEL